MPRQRQFDEQDILHRSMMLFWEKGYAGSSMKNIEDRLQLSPPSIYNAFGSKLGLFEKTIQFYIDQVVRERIREHLQESTDPLTGLQGFYTSVIEGFDRNNPGPGCLLTNTTAEPEQISETVATHIRDALSYIRNALKTTLCRLQEDRRLNAALDPDATADNLLLSYQGLLLIVRLGYPTQQLKQHADNSLACLKPYLTT